LAMSEALTQHAAYFDAEAPVDIHKDQVERS
jgi:hypothetical protein